MVYSVNEELVFAADDETFGIVIFDAKNGDVKKRIPAAHQKPIVSIAASPTDGGFFTCSSDCKG